MIYDTNGRDRQELSPVQALRGTKAIGVENRKRDLSCWDRTVQAVVRHDTETFGWLSSLQLPFMHARIIAERAQLDGTLDHDDDGRADVLADVYGVSHAEALTVWTDAKAEAHANELAMRAAADKRLAETRVATLEHQRMVSGAELSAALRLTEARKRSIFPAPKMVVDGKVILGKRFNTRVPTWSETAPATTAEPVIRWSLTLEQRRMIHDRLGYKLDTISAKHRAMTEPEFWNWTVKRESRTWPADQLAGRKEPGESDYHATLRLQRLEPRKRTRTEGVTAARRAYSKATGYGRTKVKELTKGMTADAILSLIGSGNVTAATRYVCHARPDKERQNRPISVNSDPISSADSTTENVTENDMSTDLEGRDRAILESWYLAKKGKPLTPANVRKWRERGTLDRNLFTACEFVMADTMSWPATFAVHAQMRMRLFREKRTEMAQHKRYERLSGNLVRLAG